MTMNGAVKNKWVTFDTGTYYFTDSGAAAVGWTDIDHITYYFGSDGKLGSGWTEIDGKKYFLDKGAQLRGPFTASNGIYYVIGDAGYAKEGWCTWNTQRYYTDANAIPYTSVTMEIDGVTYKFDRYGVATEVE
jgi:glucan-binding YG repeat protein